MSSIFHKTLEALQKWSFSFLSNFFLICFLVTFFCYEAENNHSENGQIRLRIYFFLILLVFKIWLLKKDFFPSGWIWKIVKSHTTRENLFLFLFLFFCHQLPNTSQHLDQRASTNRTEHSRRSERQAATSAKSAWFEVVSCFSFSACSFTADLFLSFSSLRFALEWGAERARLIRVGTTAKA